MRCNVSDVIGLPFSRNAMQNTSCESIPRFVDNEPLKNFFGLRLSSPKQYYKVVSLFRLLSEVSTHGTQCNESFLIQNI